MPTKAFLEAEARNADEEVRLWHAVHEELRKRPAIQAAEARFQEDRDQADVRRHLASNRILGRISEIATEQAQIEAEISKLEEQRTELEAALVTEVPP